MKKRLINKTLSRWILLLLMLVTGTTQSVAQNVTIDLVHGSLLAAMTDAGETGSAQGFKALWRHEQLALSMTGSDRDGLTLTGEVSEPSAVFGERDGKIIVTGGRRPSYIVVSLPKGYRITGYTLVLVNDLVGESVGAGTGGFASISEGDDFVSQEGETEATMRFYETKPWETDKTNSGTTGRNNQYPGYNENQVRYLKLGTGWDYENNTSAGGTIGTASTDVLATAECDGDTDINPSDAGKKFTISRTSTNEVPMGNQIYFRLVKDYCYYGLTIESFEIKFTAEGTFTANVKPTEESDEAVSMDASPFKTNKIDIGEMTMNPQPGNESNVQYSYKWGNVTDLDAFNYIYQQDAHETNSDLGGEVPADVAPIKKIIKVDNGGGNLYYGLKNDIYYVETPIQIKNKADNMVPIGYRIVGGKINYALGSEDYSIQLYDRTGTKISGSGGLITVNSANATGSIDLGVLNNDAIKFEILGSGTDGAFANTGGMALVTVDLYLQALNPYIDKMDIVCHDNRDVLQLTQSFTADNFSVAGDRFIFYVPADYGNEDLTFTFSGLYSKYGDETYYGRGEGAARYSFVRSPYFIPVDGYTEGNKGLYDRAYSPDAPYTNKVYTSNAGKYRFKFNNAEDLAATGSATTTGHLIEYPFSVKKYMNTENPGDPTAHPAVPASTDTGKFIDCVLNASKENQKSGTYYVFTADETRWNIAPTDGWQHRYYAFYRMEIELRAKTFSPKLDFTKIYDKTFYNDGTGDKEDSMWGLTLDVSDTDNTGQKVTGYLTYQEIIDNIIGREETLWTADDQHLPNEAAIGTVKYAAIASKLDATNTDAPADIKQILYIDGTPLYAMLNSSQYSDVKTLEDLKELLNPNALVFLPENTTSTLDNVAYETSSTESTKELQAGGDIVLTDKIPFYTPYDIQVDAAKYAMYTRKVTKSTYADVQYATVFMPFNIKLTNGQHTDADYGTMEFMQMNENNATSDKYFNYYSNTEGPTAFFTKTTANNVEANTPYALKIVDKGKSSDSFTLRQSGAYIVKTPKTDVLFSDEVITSTGNLTDKYGKSNAYSFTHVGTFSGGKVAREEQKLFYFANNGFFSSEELLDKYTTVDIYPYRSVYQTSGSGPAKVGFLMLVEGENPDMATGIKDVAKVFTGVTTGRGYITITTDADTAYRIRTVSGQNIDALNLKAGESRTVNVPAGIYLVNGLKVLVK